MPPRTHNLVRIAEATQLSIDENDWLFLDELTSFSLEVRYPDYKRSFFLKCTKDFCEEKLDKIKEFKRWLESNLQQTQSSVNT